MRPSPSDQFKGIHLVATTRSYLARAPMRAFRGCLDRRDLAATKSARVSARAYTISTIKKKTHRKQRAVVYLFHPTQSEIKSHALVKTHQAEHPWGFALNLPL